MDLVRRPGPSVRVRVHEVNDTSSHGREDRVATEEPLEVRLAWPGHDAQRVSVTMRTPGQDFELAAGLLFAEGVLVPHHLAQVAYCTDVQLTPEEDPCSNVTTPAPRSSNGWS